MDKNKKEYRFFGVMLDMSRNAVMKVSEVKKMIDHLHKMGYNMLQLYTEDTYEIDGEPYFGYMRGRYTGKEIKEIDAYAKSKGVELIPCVQTLAHFTNLVRHAAYKPIVDVNDILLAGDEKTYELIDKIFKTLAENFTSRYVNIGMDEAHMVGLGRYLDKNGFQNRFDILIDHLKRVTEIAEKYGFKPHMWGDMFFRLLNRGTYLADSVQEVPEEVRKQVPENVALAYWDYYNVEKENYDVMLDSYAKFGREVWFAGGAWSWNGFAPLNKYSLMTMGAAMKSVVERDVKDVLITMWGDNGKECSFYALLPSLYTIRQYADGNFNQAKIEKGFNKLFKLKYDEFMALDLPNTAVKPILDKKGKEFPQNPCKSLLYADPFMGLMDKVVESEYVLPYAEYEKTLSNIAKKAGEFSYIFDMESKLCSVLAIKAELGVKTRRAYKAKDMRTLALLVKDYATLQKRLQKFHEAFCALWEKENKPFGWEIQDARLGGLNQRVKTCEIRLRAYIKGKTDKIDELEEEILPYIPNMYFQCNNYQQIVSFNTF